MKSNENGMTLYLDHSAVFAVFTLIGDSSTFVSVPFERFLISHECFTANVAGVG